MTPQSHDSILDLLPPPFEWCEIPAGQIKLKDYHKIYDVQPFKMAKYPVTYAQFQMFIDAEDGFHNPAWQAGLEKDVDHWRYSNEQKWKIDNHPRDNVSWWQAVTFCRWLASRVGYEIRLPAEWEWQWAAQGPDGRKYPWGEEYIIGYANTNERDIAPVEEWGKDLDKTTPVDAYPNGASPFGVLDMAGNVWEWCLNPYNPSLTALYGNDIRQLRGGSYKSNRYDADSFASFTQVPHGTQSVIGFRLARP